LSLNHSLKIQQDNRFRFSIALFIFLIGALFSVHEDPSKLIWFSLLFISYNFVFGLGHLLAKKGQASAFLQYALLAVDVTVVTAAIYLTGRLESPLYILYLITFGLCLYHESISDFVYSVVLSFSLYVGFIVWEVPFDFHYLFNAVGQLILMGVLTGALYAILLLMVANRKERERLVSRSRTMAHIADILSGSLTSSKDWIKSISNMLEEEVRKDDLKCRIALHRSNQPLLPPSGGKIGIRIPIMVGDYIFGTMIVTRESKKPLTGSERDFFSSIAKSLGLSLHRARLWEDFQRQLKNVEAKMLLEEPLNGNSDNGSPSKEKHEILDDMMSLVQIERGNLQLKKEACHIEAILNEVIGEMKAKKKEPASKIRVIGPLGTIPPFLADGIQLQRVVWNMLSRIVQLNPKNHDIVINLGFDASGMTVKIQDQNVPSASAVDPEVALSADPWPGNGSNGESQRLRLVFCRKIVEAHKGRFWVLENQAQGGDSYGFMMPLEPVSEQSRL